MAEQQQTEDGTLDKKMAAKAAKMKKKEEKRQKKGLSDDDNQEGSSVGGKLAVVLITMVILAVWIGILGLLIKLDVGGFGSTILYPVLKDVPYVNRILPEVQMDEVVDIQYPYSTLSEAIEQIKVLELALDEARNTESQSAETIAQLQAEVARLQEFENQQAAFEEERTKFYQEVVFSDQAPDIEEYKVYYESIDPANAAELYKQVVQQDAYDSQVEKYAQAYSSMKPKQAAGIMEAMTDDLDLVAKILDAMDIESRGDILGAMDSTVAAQVTKLMEPQEP